jgi:hypothetical protein
VLPFVHSSRAPLRLHTLAIAVGLPQDWLRAEAEAGRIPCLKAGNVLLFNRAAVERALLELAASANAQEGANAV